MLQKVGSHASMRTATEHSRGGTCYRAASDTGYDAPDFPDTGGAAGAICNVCESSFAVSYPAISSVCVHCSRPACGDHRFECDRTRATSWCSQCLHSAQSSNPCGFCGTPTLNMGPDGANAVVTQPGRGSLRGAVVRQEWCRPCRTSYTFNCATCAVITAVTSQIECTMCPALVCTGCARVDRAWIHDRRFCEPCSHRYLSQEGESTESGDSEEDQSSYATEQAVH